MQLKDCKIKYEKEGWFQYVAAIFSGESQIDKKQSSHQHEGDKRQHFEKRIDIPRREKRDMICGKYAKLLKGEALPQEPFDFVNGEEQPTEIEIIYYYNRIQHASASDTSFDRDAAGPANKQQEGTVDFYNP